MYNNYYYYYIAVKELQAPHAHTNVSHYAVHIITNRDLPIRNESNAPFRRYHVVSHISKHTLL